MKEFRCISCHKLLGKTHGKIVHYNEKDGIVEGTLEVVCPKCGTMNYTNGEMKPEDWKYVSGGIK